MSWPIVEYNGKEWFRFEGDILIPVDVSTGAPILLLRPGGGSTLINVPAIAQGDPGLSPELEEAINLTLLEHDDPSPDGASWTTITPPGPATGGKYRLNLTMHKPEPGEDGNTVLDPDDFANPAPGKVPAVNAAGDGFELVAQKVGDRYLPAEVHNSGTNDANTTLFVVPVPAQDFDWRPEVEAHTIITGEDVRVDLVARLGNENSGNVVARCVGVASSERLQVTSMPPAGSVDGFDKVLKGNAVNVYVRTELRSGAGTYTTSASSTFGGVRVRPVV